MKQILRSMQYVSNSTPFMTTLGIDIGASKVAGALVKEGFVLRRAKIVYRRKTSAEINAAVLSVAKQVTGNSKIRGIGVGVPCALGKRKEVLGCANTPALNPAAIAKILARKYHAPVTIENDVKVAALAELTHGIGRKSKNFVFVAFGSGIGGAIVVDGKIYTGALGWAGEFGHMKMHIMNNKSKTVFANWEKLASAQFLKSYRGANVMKIFAKNIAVGLLNIVYVLAPEYIVVGGGLVNLWNKKFLHAVISEMKKSELPMPKIVLSRFGEYAGAYGAALLTAVKNSNE